MNNAKVKGLDTMTRPQQLNKAERESYVYVKAVLNSGIIVKMVFEL